MLSVLLENNVPNWCYACHYYPYFRILMYVILAASSYQSMFQYMHPILSLRNPETAKKVRQQVSDACIPVQRQPAKNIRPRSASVQLRVAQRLQARILKRKKRANQNAMNNQIHSSSSTPSTVRLQRVISIDYVPDFDTNKLEIDLLHLFPEDDDCRKVLPLS